jgi:hypothetical protein
LDERLRETKPTKLIMWVFKRGFAPLLLSPSPSKERGKEGEGERG